GAVVLAAGQKAAWALRGIRRGGWAPASGLSVSPPFAQPGRGLPFRGLLSVRARPTRRLAHPQNEPRGLRQHSLMRRRRRGVAAVTAKRAIRAYMLIAGDEVGPRCDRVVGGCSDPRDNL